jgi:hypothetical protein
MYAIHYSPLTGNINIGRPNKTHTTWATKEEHTIPAALAVAQWIHQQHNGQLDLTPTTGNAPAYRITVQRTNNQET